MIAQGNRLTVTSVIDEAENAASAIVNFKAGWGIAKKYAIVLGSLVNFSCRLLGITFT